MAQPFMMRATPRDARQLRAMTATPPRHAYTDAASRRCRRGRSHRSAKARSLRPNYDGRRKSGVLPVASQLLLNAGPASPRHWRRIPPAQSWRLCFALLKLGMTRTSSNTSSSPRRVRGPDFPRGRRCSTLATSSARSTDRPGAIAKKSAHLGKSRRHPRGPGPLIRACPLREQAGGRGDRAGLIISA